MWRERTDGPKVGMPMLRLITRANTTGRTPIPALGQSRQRLAAAALIAAGLVALLAGGVAPAAGADPTPTPTASPSATVFRQSTYRALARVPQFTLTQCVGASAQTMLNQIRRRLDRSASTQRSLLFLARHFSLYRGDGGADPFGWASAMRVAGGGKYRAIGEPTLAAALWVGAKMMRLTNRPIGTTVWNGAHAWQISGFESTADPATTDDFVVTAVYPIDPLWPRYLARRSQIVYPLARMDITRLATFMTRYRDPRKDPRIQNLFVVIVPVGADWILPTPPAALLPPSPRPSPSPIPSLSPSPSGGQPRSQPPDESATPSVVEPGASPEFGATSGPSPAPAVSPAPSPSPSAAGSVDPGPGASPEPTPTPGSDGGASQTPGPGDGSPAAS
jgi:hypothetical protein